MKAMKATTVNKSVIRLLKEKNLVNDKLLVCINQLSIEDLIAIKLELSANNINNRLYGLPVWKNLTNLVKDAIFKYAYSATRTQMEAMRLLGLTANHFHKLKKRYDPISYFED